VVLAGLGCGGAQEKPGSKERTAIAPIAKEGSTDQIAEIADGIRSLVARCEEIGAVNSPPKAPRVLVIDLRDGKRHKATDELPEIRRGQPSDPDLLVFAVVSVNEELLFQFYRDGPGGIQLSAKVAVVRWPKKEPLGFYRVSAPPPDVTAVRKGETPRGDLGRTLSYAITANSWQNGIEGSWESTDEANWWYINFRSEGTFSLHDSVKHVLGLPWDFEDIQRRNADYFKYRVVNKSTVELEFDRSSHAYLGKTARITDLTDDTCKLTLELHDKQSQTFAARTYILQRRK
jgi:hypothetical protein